MKRSSLVGNLQYSVKRKEGNTEVRIRGSGRELSRERKRERERKNKRERAENKYA